MARGEDVREILGDWLRRRREPLDDIGIAGSTLRAWMSGRIQAPRTASLRAIADEIERRAGADLATAARIRELIQRTER